MVSKVDEGQRWVRSVGEKDKRKVRMGREEVVSD